MPFTLSHPIAVAPLWALCRRVMPVSALVIGAMVPDVAYFVALRPTGQLGHTLPGVLLQGLPAGWVMYLCWTRVIRAPFRQALPGWVASRWQDEQSLMGRGVVWCVVTVSVGIVCGALTHIGWDSFTHKTGEGVQAFPVLMRTRLGLPLYSWLQYAGGVLGGVGCVMWLMWSLYRAECEPRPEARLRLGAWALWICGSVCGVIAALWPVWGGGVHVMLVRAVIGVCTGFAVSIMCYGLIHRALQGARRCS